MFPLRRKEEHPVAAAPVQEKHPDPRQQRGTANIMTSVRNLTDGDARNITKIDGRYEGKIEVGNGIDSETVLWISKTGHITGGAVAEQVFIEGKVDGEVRAKVVVIDGAGHIGGKVTCQLLICQNPDEADIRATISGIKKPTLQAVETVRNDI